MISVPEKFRPHHPFEYPSGNKLIFEEWFYQNYPGDVSDREYLPIFFTSYYVKNGFGKNYPAIYDLQYFLNKLDKKKKYFVLVQYDDGILNDISELDIKVYAMSGPRVDYALPLLCQPHPYEFNEPRNILCSFIGRITHPIRQNIFDAFYFKNDCVISDTKYSSKEYCRILSKSKYVLCPRGYGWNSFRIAEALQYGATPIIISDDYKNPHNADLAPGWKYPENEISAIMGDILSDSEFWDSNPFAARYLYELLFTFESNMSLILADLKDEPNLKHNTPAA